ncbi:choice-of-anchor I family protein [Fulvivirga sediminis]|uniref:Choice-of-anchor I family protein n=1 Tax=Fulvivirga sediminis TaxID=2803949 RepID=A0A937F5Y0_9BACT|nr:choice-of-anchor I family protein [Fulvivirga sediminis]MBL3657032.1 choice-of-anchor I family protein [Fulvivirga sediminis]
MRNILFMMLFLGIVFSFESCSDDEDCCTNPQFLEFESAAGSMPEDSSGYMVPFYFSEGNSENVTVVINISTDAVYGEDYTTEPSGESGSISVVVSANERGSSFKVSPINNEELTGDFNITFKLSDEKISIGGVNKFVLTIKEDEVPLVENPSSFEKLGGITLSGGEGAAEISAFDPFSNRLFVVNNAGDSRIDVLNFSDPADLQFIASIDVTGYGGGVNSVAVKNGLLAAAVEADNKQANGSVVIFNTSNYNEIEVVTVGALPDMVSFSPDGKYLLCANEGEPNDNYDIDPEGSVSIIDIEANYTVTTLSFESFASQQADLTAAGFRIFGPDASFAEDIEPEYITISHDSRYAWVSLQENNGIAKVDIQAGTITDIFPLGFKDFNMVGNEIDPSDKDGGINFGLWPMKGIYMPDALAYFSIAGADYIITANEGDTRDYDGYSEEERVKDLRLDNSVFTDLSIIDDENLGRLTVTTSLGFNENTSSFDQLYVPGGRSFSIWNGSTGALVYDCGSSMERAINEYGLYDDSRSDNKGVEPEGVAIGIMGNRTIAFIGLERVDAVVIYDVTDPLQPKFLQILETGDAPEGIIFISAEESPTGRSLLVVSSEDDGQVLVFQPEIVI